MSASGEERAMVNNLGMVQVAAMLDVIPLELTVIDTDDAVTYWNGAKVRQSKITASVLGTDVRDGHSAASRPLSTR